MPGAVRRFTRCPRERIGRPGSQAPTNRGRRAGTVGGNEAARAVDTKDGAGAQTPAVGGVVPPPHRCRPAQRSSREPAGLQSTRCGPHRNGHTPAEPPRGRSARRHLPSRRRTIHPTPAGAGQAPGAPTHPGPPFRQPPHPRHGAPVAQLERAQASEAWGHRFESCRAHHPPHPFRPIRAQNRLHRAASSPRCGKVAEWFKAGVLKTSAPQGAASSNLALSARRIR